MKGRKGSSRPSGAGEGGERETADSQALPFALSNKTIFTLEKGGRESMLNRHSRPRQSSYMQMARTFIFYSRSLIWASGTWQLHRGSSEHSIPSTFKSDSLPPLFPSTCLLTVPVLVFLLQRMETPSFKQVRNVGTTLDTSFTFRITQSCRFVTSGNCPLASMSLPPSLSIFFHLGYYTYLLFGSPSISPIFWLYLKGYFQKAKWVSAFPIPTLLRSQTRI